MDSRQISELDQQTLQALLEKYPADKLIAFLQENKPQEVLEVKDYSLGRVNKKLASQKLACKKLIIKFRGHDAGVFSFFGEENLKRYIESYGDYELPKEFIEFPNILSTHKILAKIEEVVIYFPFVLFEHKIFDPWNKALLGKKRATIIAQKLDSRRSFDPSIEVYQENWRYST